MRRNPFRARNITPGRLPYLFPLGHDVDQLLHRFSENNFRGQIVGPHGSGKSTLLVHLQNELEKAGNCVEAVWLEPQNANEDGAGRRAGKKQLLGIARGAIARGSNGDASDAKKVILVDGLETLSWLDRKRFLRSASQNEWGVLVTAHCDLGLPTLWEAQVDLERAGKVIASILRLDASSHITGEGDGIQTGESAISVVPPELISDLMIRHQGDMREILFSLYDWYQDVV